MPRRHLSIVIALTLLAGCGRGTGRPNPGNSMQPFAAGQIWKYHTRPGEDASRLTVCLVESYPKLGEVVHVQLRGLRLRNPHAPGGYTDEVTHLPYAADALRRSLVGLESAGQPVPPFRDGYQTWRSAYDQGKAGVWSGPVTDAIAAMESAMNP